MRIFVTILFLALSTSLFAQTDTTDLVDYSQFGEVELVKRYCNQKVLNQSSNRIISIGYEGLGGFHMPGIRLNSMSPNLVESHVNQVSSLRAQVNVPVISNSRVIWQLGANYWGSQFSFKNPNGNEFARALNANSMLSAGINTTIFKPLNEINFLIFQASADMNGVFPSTKDINASALTVSGTAIYGWKKSEKNMIGTGISRTYRAGQLIYVPVLLWNKTFNDRWGMELLLPARGFVRYNFSTSSMLQAGFELEGNQFWMPLAGSKNEEVFVQRGEIKPRIMWDKKLTGFLWFNVQAGMRVNYRFDVMDSYDAREDNQRYFTSKLGNPFYVNFSLNFVSP